MERLIYGRVFEKSFKVVICYLFISRYNKKMSERLSVDTSGWNGQHGDDYHADKDSWLDLVNSHPDYGDIPTEYFYEAERRYEEKD